MQVLGIDPSSDAGFAVWDWAPDAPVSRIKCWRHKVDTEDAKRNKRPIEEIAAEMAGHLQGLIAHFTVQQDPLRWVAMEEMPRTIMEYKRTKRDLAGDVGGRALNVRATLMQAQIAGALVATASNAGIPWEMIPITTWRKSFLGKGREKGVDRKEWKNRAVRQCDMLNISVRNHNAAEAVGIVFAATGTQRFRSLWSMEPPQPLPLFEGDENV